MILQLFLFQVLTFIGIISLLKFFYDKNMKSAVQRLRELNEENQLKESQLKEELDRAARQREEEIARGKEEANRLIESAKKSAEVLRRTIEADGRMEVDRMRRETSEGNEHLISSLNDRAKRYAIDLAQEVVIHIFKSNMKEEFHNELAKDVITEIDNINKDKFLVKGDIIKITTAYPLKVQEKERIKQVMEDKLEREVAIEESTDSSIVGGLLLEIGTFAIDGTLRNRLQKAFTLVKKDFE